MVASRSVTFSYVYIEANMEADALAKQGTNAGEINIFQVLGKMRIKKG